MNIGVTNELNNSLKQIEDRIQLIESCPNRAFILIEYETLSSFHWFNQCLNQFMNDFECHNVIQILQKERTFRTYFELREKYFQLFKEQIEYLEEFLDSENKSYNYLPPINFDEDYNTDILEYYMDILKDETDEDEEPLYNIEHDGETHIENVDGKHIPIDFYLFHSEKLNSNFLNGFYRFYSFLKRVQSLMKVVSGYPDQIFFNHIPKHEDILNTLENELRQYAKERGKMEERKLKKVAQHLNTSRDTLLTTDIWVAMLSEEDDLYDLAISGRLLENNEKRFDYIGETQRKLLSANSSLLQNIKDTAIDGEMFDVRRSVEKHNLLNSLNDENLNLFYELILRRNIIQREMFPKEMREKYEVWVNPSKERQQDNKDDIVPVTTLPDELATEQAMKYWERLKQQKFVNEHYMLLESTTNRQAMYIAEPFAEKLKIKSKWKTFQDFWGINHLAQEKNKFHDDGKSPSRSKEIDKIFED